LSSATERWMIMPMTTMGHQQRYDHRVLCRYSARPFTLPISPQRSSGLRTGAPSRSPPLLAVDVAAPWGSWIPQYLQDLITTMA
jgi:hypothetical protein